MLDDEDYENIPKKGWYLVKSEIHNSKTDYVQHDTFGKIHRYILNVSDKNLIVDHIDRNGLNNQKENLRITTCSENKRNQGTVKSNKFNFNGISYEKAGKKTGERIRVRWSTFEEDNRYIKGRKKQKVKNFNLSKFNSIDEAVRAAILFRIEKMKEFGYVLDERSTTIERKLKNNEYETIEKLLNINYKEIFNR